MSSEPRQGQYASIPALDRMLRSEAGERLIASFGRRHVVDVMRRVVAEVRNAIREDGAETSDEALILRRVERQLEADSGPSLRRVFNLTGVVLHTNLGRAALPDDAIDRVVAVARGASNLEYDLSSGRRGDRDAHVDGLITRITGAEAATVVNNNAAALLLVLNTLAVRKEVPVSRGELIEIGGSFRLPEIMRSSGCRLREVGTTNRTHLADYETAITAKTALLLKVHTSNYVVQGFTASVREADLAQLCNRRGLPFVVDLGSGTLVDLEPFGLPHEPTVAESLGNGADLVTFSGDKLTGGPQAGIIAGKSELVKRIKANPLRRALRVDKMTVAALSAVLRLYLNPDRLPELLPTVRALAMPTDDVRARANRVCAHIEDRLRGVASVSVADCASRVGSGALPVETIASAGVLIRPERKRRGDVVERIAAGFRALPIPVVGRIEDGALVLDCRCLDDEAAFVSQLAGLKPVGVE